MFVLTRNRPSSLLRVFVHTRACLFHSSSSVLLQLSSDYEAKYAKKLQQRAEEQGMSVEDLRARLKEEQARQRQATAAKPVVNIASQNITRPSSAGTHPPKVSTKPTPSVRKDSSPVKPLSSFFNLERILERSHTPDEVSLLWRAYHESRSGGTGRGYLCAAIPVAVYEKMASIASRYPFFVVPVPRDNAQIEEKPGDNQRAYEFYFMEWGFHGAPPEPSSNADIFAPPKPSNNPHTSTILFTPLQEYKHRTSFATPYLVLTHYTDLARSHGLVLLRGEITPSSASTISEGGDSRFLLQQADAQLLSMGVQKFYLWGEGKNEGHDLLKAFHESPAEFKWEDLVKHANITS